ncbi:hypothetical protein Q5692_01370 [Microcoleus sp. C2C3]|uniref:hypothetical protein n=1 Tax=unclassified Microcoleus TaxID=2642155 RepID=UPI002FD65125
MSSPNEPRIPAPLGQGVVKTRANPSGCIHHPREKLRPRKSSIDPDADESQQAMSWFTYLSNCFAPSPSGKLVELGGD